MPAPAFELPAALEAHEPPEARGLVRDGVRLLSANRSTGEITHHRFRDLPQLLRPGDLLVVNVSATLPAAVDGRRTDGSPVRVHVATFAPNLGEEWRVVELRSAGGARPIEQRARTGEAIELEGGATLELVAPYASGQRLMLARLPTDGSLEHYLRRHGHPIRYGYVDTSWPIDDYQTVYATTPGSAEMPSAGRPFTARLLDRLADRGIVVAPITLHTGVSSPERHEPPFPEWYEVPPDTAAQLVATKRAGGRVVAVGTTVVRALETAPAGGSGWTSLVIAPERGLSTVDGLITGWHEPQASHLMLLEAVAGEGLLRDSYREALAHGYRWHEFGDSHLILP
jgi:S-adenosylmethionine:tRNA ribosyltransferase-isomerase